jgi:hypothetical protein
LNRSTIFFFVNNTLSNQELALLLLKATQDLLYSHLFHNKDAFLRQALQPPPGHLIPQKRGEHTPYLVLITSSLIALIAYPIRDNPERKDTSTAVVCNKTPAQVEYHAYG